MARKPRGRPQAEEEQLAQDERETKEPTMEEFVQAMHGTADVPQDGMPTIKWLQDHFQTKSAIIRYLISKGYSVKDISKHTGFRYQMVRNVTTNPLKRGPNEDWRQPNPNLKQTESETN
jgi:hypothetical protein